jgi:hypothetical protein
MTRHCTWPGRSASTGTAKRNPSKEPVDLNCRSCNASSRENVRMLGPTVLNHSHVSLWRALVYALSAPQLRGRRSSERAGLASNGRRHHVRRHLTFNGTSDFSLGDTDSCLPNSTAASGGAVENRNADLPPGWVCDRANLGSRRGRLSALSRKFIHSRWTGRWRGAILALAHWSSVPIVPV